MAGVLVGLEMGIAVEAVEEDIEVAVDLPDGLWRIEADAGELELALLNLAVNARDAMDSDGVLTIRARRAAGEDGAAFGEIRVSDNGTGMSAEVADRVFEPFYTTRADGLGLGLSLCESLAAGMDGRLELLVRPEPGAAFRLTLPLAPAQPPQR